MLDATENRLYRTLSALPPPSRLDAVRAIAAAHAYGNSTNVAAMRKALARIVALCDGDAP